MLDIRLGDNGEVVLSGRLDAVQAPRVQKFLDGVAELPVMNFGELEYISSAGLGVLLKTQKRFEASGTLKSTVSGCRKLSNWAARKRKMISREIPKVR